MNPNDLKLISELLDQKLEPIQKELKNHGKLLKSLNKNQDTMLDMLDREQMDQRKEIKQIKAHLGLSSSTL